jgi:hypothetical protein
MELLFCPKCGSSNLNAHKTENTVVFLGAVNSGLVDKLIDERDSDKIHIICLGCASRYKLGELSKTKKNNQQLNKTYSRDNLISTMHYTCQNCKELNTSTGAKSRCIKCDHINILYESHGDLTIPIITFSALGVAVMFFIFFAFRTCNDTASESTNIAPIKKQQLQQSQIEVVVPEYKIIHTNTTYCNYEVLIGPVDLNTIEYKSDVKLILDDLAKSHGSTNFHAYFYDNQQAADLNYNDLELGEGISKKEGEFVNCHIVAVYSNFGDGRYFISYFENIPSDKRRKHKAWRDAFNQSDFNAGYTPNR